MRSSRAHMQCGLSWGTLRRSLPAVFQNYWNTLTFLLSDPPYGYNTFQIGLFGLIGILAVCLAPFTGRFIDKLVSWVGVLMGLCIQVSETSELERRSISLR